MRIVCLVIGYAFGCVLAAEIVARVKAGRSIRSIGTGNPGMANVTKELGGGWGALVLACDILKVVLPYLLCRYTIGPALGAHLPADLCALWVGVGATVGHNFPFWMRFRGGKGVTTTCATIVLFCPTWGWIALGIGLLVMLVLRQLSFGAVVLSVAFLPIAWLVDGPEALALSAVLAVLMVAAHGPTAVRALKGQQAKTDPKANLRRLFK